MSYRFGIESRNKTQVLHSRWIITVDTVRVLVLLSRHLELQQNSRVNELTPSGFTGRLAVLQCKSSQTRCDHFWGIP